MRGDARKQHVNLLLTEARTEWNTTLVSFDVFQSSRQHREPSETHSKGEHLEEESTNSLLVGTLFCHPDSLQ